jgi:hypothetical protein
VNALAAAEAMMLLIRQMLLEFLAREGAVRPRHDNIMARQADAALLKIYPGDHRDGDAWNDAHRSHSTR